MAKLRRTQATAQRLKHCSRVYSIIDWDKLEIVLYTLFVLSCPTTLTGIYHTVSTLVPCYFGFTWLLWSKMAWYIQLSEQDSTISSLGKFTLLQANFWSTSYLAIGYYIFFHTLTFFRRVFECVLSLKTCYLNMNWKIKHIPNSVMVNILPHFGIEILNNLFRNQPSKVV